MLSATSLLPAVRTLRPNQTPPRLDGLRIACVESDPLHADQRERWLESAGHRCRLYERGDSLIAALLHESFDAVLINSDLPDIGALEILRLIRRGKQATVPVLLIAKEGREEDVVTALRQGADDCMVRPDRRLELLARLEAIARRNKRVYAEPDILEFGELRIDSHTRTVHRNGAPVKLTTKDFDLAVLFFRNIGRLLSRAYIREAVWGPRATLTSRTLDTHVSRIRVRLGLKSENGWELSAMYRHGYRLQQLGRRRSAVGADESDMLVA